MHYTPIEQRIIDLLSDGLPHDRKELLECLNDRLANYNSLAAAIMRLRPKVRELNQEIVTEHYQGCIAYRHVILLSGKALEQENAIS